MIILNVSGNITADAITRQVNANTLIAFTIASNERYKTKNGEYKERVTYIRCTIWNKPDLLPLLYKGRSINATGAFRLNHFEDKNGTPLMSLDLRVSFFQVFGKNKNRQTLTETHSANTPTLTNEEETEFTKDLPF